MQKIFKYCATLGPLGYMHASGTVATLATLPFIIVLAPYQTAFIPWLVGCLLAALGSYWCINRALPAFHGTHDPSAIVLDEVIGALITFCGITFSYQALCMGIMLFRIFDVRKPFFIKWSENLPGAVGIVADDVLAGLAANVVLRVMMYFV